MRPRFVGHFGLADAITVVHGMLGFAAAVVAPTHPALAARIILVAAIADGLDGVVARRLGSTAVGEHLDSLSDVSSFGVAPALLVAAVAVDDWGVDPGTPSLALAAAIGVPAIFLGMAVIRLGFYTAFDVDRDRTLGVPSTLAGTVVAAGVLAGVSSGTALVAAAGAFAYLMVSPVDYPDLLARDALLMGGVQTLAVLAPRAFGRTFPYALLTLSLAYLVLSPRFYWGPHERAA